jgi:hypothetical protein
VPDPRKTFVVVTSLAVGGLHFIIGPDYQGPMKAFVRGYLIDILLPFAVYFLIALPKVIRQPWLIALAVFGIGFVVETLQYLGLPLFGRTFDPVDYAMYAIGAVLALVTDNLYFSKLKPHEK